MNNLIRSFILLTLKLILRLCTIIPSVKVYADIFLLDLSNNLTVLFKRNVH